MELADLVEQTANRDEQAFEKLYGAYRAPLFRQAYTLLGNPETAEEVVQDAMLGIWNGATNFKGESKPYSWMRAILRNNAMSALRRHLRRPPIPATESDPASRLADPESEAQVSLLLQKLSPEHRLAVILTYYLSLSQSEISRIMHCPVGTVKSRVSNALAQMRQQLCATV